jgi:hypothetical protein
MNRTSTLLGWIMSLVLFAAGGYWLGERRAGVQAPPFVQTNPQPANAELQIAEPLTEAQHHALLRSPSTTADESIIFTLDQPGKPPLMFLAKGKLDLPEKKDGKKEPPLNNPFKGDKPPKKEGSWVAYPCKVGLDSKGNTVWGICYRLKF